MHAWKSAAKTSELLGVVLRQGYSCSQVLQSLLQFLGIFFWQVFFQDLWRGFDKFLGLASNYISSGTQGEDW